MHREPIQNRSLLFVKGLVIVIRGGPCRCAVLLWEPVGEHCEAASGDRRRSVVPRGELGGLREIIERLPIKSLKLVCSVALVSDHGAVKRGTALPSQQISSLARPLFEQQLNVLFSPREALHVIKQKTGEDVFPNECVHGKPGVRE